MRNSFTLLQTSPIPDCPDFRANAITTEMVQGVLTGDHLSVDSKKARAPLWERFLAFRLRCFQPKTGKIVQCGATPGCPYQVIVSQELASVECPICGKSFCSKCGLKSHPKNSCAEYKKWLLDNDSGEQKLEELLEAACWCRCPVCNVPVEREAGCNFMQCPSQICRNRTFFCYVCGDLVRKVICREGGRGCCCQQLNKSYLPHNTAGSRSRVLSRRSCTSTYPVLLSNSKSAPRPGKALRSLPKGPV